MLHKAKQPWKHPQNQQLSQVPGMHPIVLDQVAKLTRPPHGQRSDHWHIYVDGSANITIEEEKCRLHGPSSLSNNGEMVAVNNTFGPSISEQAM